MFLSAPQLLKSRSNPAAPRISLRLAARQYNEGVCNTPLQEQRGVAGRLRFYSAVDALFLGVYSHGEENVLW